MTSTRALQSAAELTKAGGALDLGREPARLLVHMLRLLARSAPVTRQHADRALAELGIDQHTARQYLDAWTERNDHADIVGLGLTYNKTPHRC
ncbi:MAG: hypothetical protein ACRD0W_24635 [Acidimicrobiales bacterium]